MNTQIRWGILSTANIGRRAVAPAINNAKNGQLAAVASRNLTTAQAYATELGIPKAYGSYEALLADPTINAIYIPLPNSMHLEWTLKAAEAGKHVLCEKPLGLTEAECLRMHEAATANNITLMEAFMYRFHPRTEAVLKQVQQGELGTPTFMRSVFTFKLTNPENIRLNPELGGGALMDVGCYCVNISRTLLGEPTHVQATATWANSGVDDTLSATLTYKNGATAQFQCALTLPREETYTIAGNKKRLELPAAFLPGVANVNIRVFDDGNESTPQTFTGVDEYQCMVEHFADCVLNKQAPRYDATEAAANMRVIEALYRSARKGGQPEMV